MPDALEIVDQRVADWVLKKSDVDQIDLLEGYLSYPAAAEPEPGVIDVVFEGRSGSRMWKDWMVQITDDVSRSVSGVRFVGFWEGVAEALHPASLSGRTDPGD